MLDEYLTKTRSLLQVILPNPSTNLYNDTLLTRNINWGRKRLAADGEAISVIGTLAIDATTNVYQFSAIDTGSSATTGIDGVYVVRQASVVVGDGFLPLYARSYPWFRQYHTGEVVPATSVPKIYSQYGQGSSGSLYFWPTPDVEYTINLDCLGVPVDLEDDTTVEAIPFPFTECVPFIACYFTLQSPQRQADADLMLKRYNEYLKNARDISNPSVLPFQSRQAPDPTSQNKLGTPPAR